MAPASISVEGGRGSGRSPEVCFLVLVFMNWAEEGGTTTPPYWSLVIGLQLLSLTLPRVSAFFFDKVSNTKGLRPIIH